MRRHLVLTIALGAVLAGGCGFLPIGDSPPPPPPYSGIAVYLDAGRPAMMVNLCPSLKVATYVQVSEWSAAPAPIPSGSASGYESPFAKGHAWGVVAPDESGVDHLVSSSA